MNSTIGLRRLWTIALVVSGLLGTGCFGLTADEGDDSSEQALETAGEVRRPLAREPAPGVLQAGPVPNPWVPCISDPSTSFAVPPPCITVELKAPAR